MARGANGAYALPKGLRQQPLKNLRARQRLRAAADQGIQRGGEGDHDLGMDGVLRPLDDLGWAAAAEDRWHQTHFRVERIVERADQKRQLVLIADHAWRLAARVVAGD